MNNAITDVKGVRVGHVTRLEDDAPVPGTGDTTRVRTGVTAIIPGSGDVFRRRMVAGGFVLNGVGEMAGLTQAMEWGLIETPILLTNSLSVGRVLNGVGSYMVRRHPEIGDHEDVVLPVVGEADDSFLNDARVGIASGQDAVKAIESARDGPVAQGSVGAGCGMITCDFAGGIGTASRAFPIEENSFTLGALVLSNFGRLVNLTVDGRVVGRELDPQYPDEGRRRSSYGSAIVVLATDVPLLSHQLGRIAKRAALGLGRVGIARGLHQRRDRHRVHDREPRAADHDDRPASSDRCASSPTRTSTCSTRPRWRPPRRPCSTPSSAPAAWMAAWTAAPGPAAGHRHRSPAQRKGHSC